MEPARIAACMTLAAALVAVPAAASGAEIPDWIRQIASFWAEGRISDAEFAEAIRYLSGQGVTGAPVASASELPLVIGPPHTMSERGECSINIHGVLEGSLVATTEPPGPCDIRTFDEADGSMVGGIRIIHADGSHHVVYAPWVPFDGDVADWEADPGEPAGIEIIYHDLANAYADAYGTIYFDRTGVSAVYAPVR
ncbi:MAG: hypothetical protein MPJ06_07910 [Nitrosopumilus sp.]|nr:hypothetical protein [Nitrosopumilus sp.]MDA7943905.1 hypothetical protein [Nitrosopumilus sp.]MDA7959939.1 hypothetical protein [Nitrosopumilus sp.]MDA7998960.1 hypothetical protein [Nitrosopumilus sp.]